MIDDRSTSAARCDRARACCASSTTSACSPRPTSTSRCAWPRSRGETDEPVVLAAALAVRAPRLGHVFVDLATIRETAAVESDEPVDLTTLPWPEVEAWVARAARRARSSRSGRTRRRAARCGSSAPALYLDRYWREERQVAADLRALGGAQPVDEPRARPTASTALFAGLDGPRASGAAAATAVRRRFAVVAGGPGHGQDDDGRADRRAARRAGRAPIAAASRSRRRPARRRRGCEEAVHAEAAKLDVAPASATSCSRCSASTLHRLLGWRPGSHSRFRHNRGNRLPHDVVIVDETSMVSLSLMARLVEAVRPEARLVLVGDPGPADVDRGRRGARRHRRRAGGAGVVVLEHVYRYGAGIDALAAAIRAGDGDAAIARAARRPRRRHAGSPVDVGDPASLEALAPVRDGAVARRAARSSTPRARATRAARSTRSARSASCARTAAARTACASGRRGSRAGSRASSAAGRWYPGRPLLVTENDYGLRLYNGDTGVVVATGDGRVARGVRAPRRGRRVRARAARRGRDRLRDDRPQERRARSSAPPRCCCRRRRRRSSPASCSTRRSPAPQRAADPRRHRGDDPRRGRRPVARASGLGRRLRVSGMIAVTGATGEAGRRVVAARPRRSAARSRAPRSSAAPRCGSTGATRRSFGSPRTTRRARDRGRRSRRRGAPTVLVPRSEMDDPSSTTSGSSRPTPVLAVDDGCGSGSLGRQRSCRRSGSPAATCTRARDRGGDRGHSSWPRTPRS